MALVWVTRHYLLPSGQWAALLVGENQGLSKMLILNHEFTLDTDSFVVWILWWYRWHVSLAVLHLNRCYFGSISGVFLLFSDGGECWVRSMFSQDEYSNSRPSALRTPSNSILVSILGSFIYYSYFIDREMEAQRKQVTCPSSLWGAGSWALKLLELGWTIHPRPHETSFQHPKSHVLGNPSVSGRSEMVGHPKWNSNCGPFSILYNRNRGT